jgi:hypothetical protein
MPYTKTDAFPSHGVPDASDDITGGIGWTGMANLEEFLSAGGMLITLGNGSTLALEGGLARGVSATSNDAVTPGSELQTTFLKPDHPIAYGYAPQGSAFRSNYTVYNIQRAHRDQVVMQWGSKPMKDDRDEEAEKDAKDENDQEADETDLLVSGGIKNGDSLQGHPAILDIPVGKGRVIAFNFNPMHRDLNRSDHRFLWNAILNWQRILQTAPAMDES